MPIGSNKKPALPDVYRAKVGTPLRCGSMASGNGATDQAPQARMDRQAGAFVPISQHAKAGTRGRHPLRSERYCWCPYFFHRNGFMPVRVPCQSSLYVSLTSCLPKFSPLSIPMSAFGAFSNPSAILSRYFSFPLATSACNSCLAWGKT
jgi:hypothetical protein